MTRSSKNIIEMHLRNRNASDHRGRPSQSSPPKKCARKLASAGKQIECAQSMKGQKSGKFTMIYILSKGMPMTIVHFSIVILHDACSVCVFSDPSFPPLGPRLPIPPPLNAPLGVLPLPASSHRPSDKPTHTSILDHQP